MAQIGRLSNVFFGWCYLWRTAFVSAALLGITGPALALERVQPANGYIRTNFTVEDGLLSNTVNAVLQTRDGFLWNGTDDGLLRFDGRHFTAVEFLAGEIRNLLYDAEASKAYFLSETMGRSAGWLSYGAAIAGEASLVISVEAVS